MKEKTRKENFKHPTRASVGLWKLVTDIYCRSWTPSTRAAAGVANACTSYIINIHNYALWTWRRPNTGGRREKLTKNPQILAPHFFRINFNIILPRKSVPSKWHLPIWFPNNSATFLISMQAVSPAHLILHLINPVLSIKSKTMKLRFSLSSCYSQAFSSELCCQT